jgi:NAD(P)-dependent dehydrogenase (short-subunit alcohol dehydrogenase family)
MQSVLVTGASRGLGLEFARQYAADGHRVFACARHPEQATDLRALSVRYPSVSVHTLVVGDRKSVKVLAAELSTQSIDILINNAGVAGPEAQNFGETDDAAWLDVMKVNALGALQVCEAFVSHVERGSRKLMAAITSGMGSIADASGGSYAYRCSKAALNMILRCMASDLRSSGVIALSVNPGWVRTDMGGDGARLSPGQSVSSLRRIFDRVGLEDSGKFLNWNGREFLF